MQKIKNKKRKSIKMSQYYYTLVHIKGIKSYLGNISI